MSGDFSIGTLAERTGVTTNLLRTWENRFGFPAGRRTPSGHRRFSDADVSLVQEVLREREAGIPLAVAVDTVVRRNRHRQDESVHAALVEEVPDLRPVRLSERTLVAASHAIEDEALARAERPVVLGTFQEGHRFERSRHRWEELGRTATWSAVVADFDAADGPAADPGATPARCQLPPASPMRREWTVVAVGSDLAAVLSAWEVPRPPDATGPRVYEAVVSTRRAAALTAARVIAGVAVTAGATPTPQAEAVLADMGPAAPRGGEADRVWLRALAHLDRAHLDRATAG